MDRKGSIMIMNSNQINIKWQIQHCNHIFQYMHIHDSEEYYKVCSHCGVIIPKNIVITQ